MNPTVIESVRIRGFRSLADVEISDLPRATVLIGANGSGKSNFIHFFEMLNAIGYRRLSDFVEIQGGADDQLCGGNRVTPQLEAESLYAPTEVVTAINSSYLMPIQTDSSSIEKLFGSSRKVHIRKPIGNTLKAGIERRHSCKQHTYTTIPKIQSTLNMHSLHLRL